MRIIIHKMGISLGLLSDLDRIFRDLLYTKLAEDEEKVVYEGALGIELPADALGLRPRSFKKFCDSVIVESGKKKRRGTVLTIEPYKRRVIRIRLSEDEYRALCECAKMRGKKPREFFEGTLMSAILARRG